MKEHNDFRTAMGNQVDWLKNDEPLRVDIPHKYQVVGNGTQLRVRNIGYADTGAYMCQATSVGGMARDISSLIVQENPAPSMYLKFVLEDYKLTVVDIRVRNFFISNSE